MCLANMTIKRLYSAEYNLGNVWNKSDELNFPTDNQTKFTVTKDKWDGNIGTWSTP